VVVRADFLDQSGVVFAGFGCGHVGDHP
jgi:hypothetical protein